jgi:hypothetical protein
VSGLSWRESPVTVKATVEIEFDLADGPGTPADRRDVILGALKSHLKSYLENSLQGASTEAKPGSTKIEISRYCLWDPGRRSNSLS